MRIPTCIGVSASGCVAEQKQDWYAAVCFETTPKSVPETGRRDRSFEKLMKWAVETAYDFTYGERLYVIEMNTDQLIDPEKYPRRSVNSLRIPSNII